MSNTKPLRTVYTAITYDHDREPLEQFLKVSAYKVVPIKVGDDESLSNAIQASPDKFAVVTSLIDSSRVRLGQAIDNINEISIGCDPLQGKKNRAGLDCVPYGVKVARELEKLNIPTLAIIFSSQITAYTRQTRDNGGNRVRFVPKESSFLGNHASYLHIAGYLDLFFDEPKKR